MGLGRPLVLLMPRLLQAHRLFVSVHLLRWKNNLPVRSASSIRPRMVFLVGSTRSKGANWISRAHTFSFHVLKSFPESCSHPFCLACIRSWRQGKEKDPGLIASGVTKACPACRQSSLYITPSSAFHSSGPGKDAVIQRYKDVMAKKPCRHFEASKETSRGPWCPFGDECHYRHALTAGDDRYIFGAGFQEMKRRWMQERSNRIFRRLGGLRHRGQRRRNGVDVDYLDTGGAESLSFDFDAGDFLDGTIPDWDAREDLLDFVDNFGDESLYFNGWDDEYGYHNDLDYYDYTGWDEDDISESRRHRREAEADRAEEAFRRAADRILFGPRSSSVRRTGSPLSLDHHQAAGQRASSGAAGEQQSNGHTDAGPVRPTASSAAEGRLSSPRSERRRAQRSFNADNRALPRSQQELASRNNSNSGGGTGTRTAPRSHRSSARASAAAPNSRGARRQAALADELDDEWEWHDDSEGGDLDADFEEPQVDEDGLQASAGNYQADTEQLEMDAFDVEDDVFGY